ncbi:MAG: MBL fold metallo-hydrolase [Desulfobacterales bacterium]|jgi:glyoxylase-like metal-dependent hydrolase (beta-lactamase superfamily II)|nr:MBL fold metallo-hydrolase [Desulfobacterales bacterium]
MQSRPKGDCPPVKLAENFWLLGNYYLSLYLVQGSHSSALIEMGVSAVTDTVINQLSSLNISPTYLIVTHPHSDHLTGLVGLSKRFPSATPVFGHGAKDFLAHPKSLEIMVREDRFISRMLAVRGERVDRPPINRFQFPNQSLTVDEFMQIDLGGVALQCRLLPGHSPGNILIHIPEKNALIASDSLGFRMPGRFFVPCFFTGFADYMNTLNALAVLKPAILGLGHQGPLFGEAVDHAFSSARQAALDLYTQITENREDRQAMADEIFRKFYIDEFTLYSEENIRSCCQLLVRRALEYMAVGGQAIS